MAIELDSLTNESKKIQEITGVQYKVTSMESFARELTILLMKKSNRTDTICYLSDNKKRKVTNDWLRKENGVNYKISEIERMVYSYNYLLDINEEYIQYVKHNTDNGILKQREIDNIVNKDYAKYIESFVKILFETKSGAETIKRTLGNLNDTELEFYNLTKGDVNNKILTAQNIDKKHDRSKKQKEYNELEKENTKHTAPKRENATTYNASNSKNIFNNYKLNYGTTVGSKNCFQNKNNFNGHNR